MRQRLLIFLVLTAALAFGVAILALSSLGRVDGPTYTLAQVEAGLELQPKEWLGKTIRLRAFVFAVPMPCLQVGTGQCGTADLLLDNLSRLPVSPTLSAPQQADGRSSTSVRTDDPAAGQPLLLRPESDRLLDGLRGIPGLGRLLPGPQSLDGGTLRVTIESTATSYLCPKGPCFEAALHDARPSEAAVSSQGLAPYQQGMAGFVYGPTPSPSN
jgi:hypothetical protein